MRRWAILFLVVLSLPLAADQQADAQAEDEGGVWSEVMRLYERAKLTGEQVPRDVYQWVKEDFESIGDWEYRVVDVSSPASGTLETTLNEMGAERWECIFIQATGSGTRLIMKRPRKAYLRHLPVSDILKLIPTDGDAAAGE